MNKDLITGAIASSLALRRRAISPKPLSCNHLVEDHIPKVEISKTFSKSRTRFQQTLRQMLSKQPMILETIGNNNGLVAKFTATCYSILLRLFDDSGRLNCLLTGVACFGLNMFRWDPTTTAMCESKKTPAAASHIVHTYPHYSTNHHMG